MIMIAKLKGSPGAAIKVVVLAAMLALGPLAGFVRADEVQDVMKAWLAGTANQSTIPPGTKITMQNWQQYKQFMPLGMVDFFEGKYFWKMPSDVEFDVGPTVMHPLPKAFMAATEKYGGQARVVHLPDGRMSIENYTGGFPFPNPQDPDKGYKILTNVWFPPNPYLLVLSPDSGDASFCTVDHFNNQACSKSSVVYRQLAFNWDPRTPKVEPKANGAWFSQWLMLDKPEQSKYTAVLTLFWQDLTKDEDDYVFVPALRRSLRLSATARCSPLFGSDMIKDDQRGGYNGGITLFNADFLGTRKMLANTDLTMADGNFPAEYDMPLGWAKPSWGGWQVRQTNVLDIRRIPSMRQGYCYGSKVMYIDTQFYHQVWEDIYDGNLKLWKIVAIQLHPSEFVPGEGPSPLDGALVEQFWDIQNDHVSHVFTANPDGKTDGLTFNTGAPKQFDDVNRFSTPGGLMTIMR
jgi:Protein of unknown function (DUF1329)